MVRLSDWLETIVVAILAAKVILRTSIVAEWIALIWLGASHVVIIKVLTGIHATTMRMLLAERIAARIEHICSLVERIGPLITSRGHICEISAALGAFSSRLELSRVLHAWRQVSKFVCSCHNLVC